jgi:hypothetical protein
LLNLLDALTDEQRDDVRLAAIDVLQHWTGLKPEHDLRLFQALKDKQYPEGQAEIILQLLHTFSDTELNNPGTYETLIEYLRHDKLPVRELAYWHLRILVPEGAKKIAYHPAGGIEQRERAYEQWKKLVPPGKLPPQAKAGAAK